MKEFKQWLDDNVHHVRPKSPLGDAFGYALNKLKKLTRYLDDGRIIMDNGVSERKIKPFVMGRKAWLFCDSVAGAKAAEIIYSIIETVKCHKVEEYSYLRYVLTHLPNITAESELGDYHRPPLVLHGLSPSKGFASLLRESDVNLVNNVALKFILRAILLRSYCSINDVVFPGCFTAITAPENIFRTT